MKEPRMRLVGVVAGMAIMVAAHGGVALGGERGARAHEKGCCHGMKTAKDQAVACPIRQEQGRMVTGDKKEIDRLRRALRDGIFIPWTQLGRAPTPTEFAARMGLEQSEANRLLDEFQACGDSVGVGILRVPQSEL